MWKPTVAPVRLELHKQTNQVGTYRSKYGIYKMNRRRYNWQDKCFRILI